MIQPIRPLILAYGLAFLALLIVQYDAYRAVEPVLAEQRFVDADSYTWLGRVERLHEGGGWYDETEPRANWPFGEDQHYNRPFDVLLLAGATALTPFLGFDAGLYTWAAALPSLLYLLLGMALAWTTSKVLGASRGPVAVLLLATQYVLLTYSLPGRADHHVLILIFLVLTWGALSRALQRIGGQRAALLAGLSAGFGLWLSLEFLVMIVACQAALVVCWIRRGGLAGRTALWFSAGALPVVVLALLAEHPPDRWLHPDYDRLSVVHLVVMGVACVFWVLMNWLDRQGSKASSVRDRGLFVLLGAGVALGSIGALLPDFFLGPLLNAEPKAVAVLGSVSELLPLWPRDRAGVLELGLTLGIACVAVPALAWLLVRERADAAARVWTFLAVAGAIYLVAALSAARFAPHAELLLLIPVAELLVRGAERLRLHVPGWPSNAAIAAATAGLLLLAVSNGNTTAETVRSSRSCQDHLIPLASFLNERAARHNTIETIAAMPDLGPELLFRTPHRVIATPNRSNEGGAIAIYDLLTPEDDVLPKQVVDERGISLLLICTLNPEQNPFFARLLAGRGPSWASPVALPPELAGYFALFATTPTGDGTAERSRGE